MNKKVLILDDSKFINAHLSNEFTKLGYSVDSALSLVEAKELLNKSSYTLALVDLTLPDGESDELIKNICKNSKTKVIVLTASRDSKRRAKLFEYGIIDYFIKDKTLARVPIEVDHILNKLDYNSGSKILIIDDSKIIHTSLKIYLTPRDYEVKSAYSGKDGIDMIMKHEYDLILLDLTLGDIDGDMVLELIKSNPTFALTPVIILSGTSDEDIVLKLYKLGACDFISKPFMIEEFLLKIDTWIDYNRLHKNLQNERKILNQYKDAVDNSSIVSKTDTKGVITYVNDKFCKVSGYTKEELVGQPHNIVRDPSNAKQMFEDLWETIKSKKTFNAIIQNRAKDGSTYYVDTTISPIVNRNDEIIEYIAIRNLIGD